MQPFEFTADRTRNVLHAHFRGKVHGSDMRKCVDTLGSALEQLASPFTLLTDLTDLESMDLDCVPQLTRFMDSCRAAGLSKVVRIIPHPEKDIGFKLLSLTHYRGEVTIVTCTSREEADRELLPDLDS